jgi:hypothetical protein
MQVLELAHPREYTVEACRHQANVVILHSFDQNGKYAAEKLQTCFPGDSVKFTVQWGTT